MIKEDDDYPEPLIKEGDGDSTSDYNDDHNHSSYAAAAAAAAASNSMGNVNREPADDEHQSANLNGKFSGTLLLYLGIAVLGGSFQFGWNIGLFNIPESVIKSFFVKTYFDRYKEMMTPSTLTTLWSILNGLFPAGGVIGGLSSGFIADMLGRRKSMIFTNGLVILSAVLNIVSKFIPSYETLMVARFFAGVACGVFTGVVPMYLNELPPQNLRGFTGTMNQLTIVFGILVTNVFGLSKILGTPDLWPVLVGLMLIPCLAHAGLFFAVESPKYLYINKNDVEGAKKALIKLRGGDENLVSNELDQLAAEKQRLSQQRKILWSDFIEVTTLFRPIIVASVLQLSQQLSGINAVIFYSTNIFKSVGLEEELAQYASILLNVVQLVMTIGCMFLVDRLGRRILLITGMAGMCVFAYLLAIFSIIGDQNPNAKYLNYLTVVCAVFYVIFFSVGPGAIPWLITAELFGSEARGKASSIAVFINWTANLIVTVSFPFLSEGIGSYSFIVFGSLLVFFTAFMILFVPETKNKSIEEIQSGFSRGFLVLGRRN